jgi:transposase
MAAPRRVVEISIAATDLIELEAIARSRTEWACRVQRARILLAYHADPSTYAVGEAIGVTHQTVHRCLDRAVRFGVMAALDDSPRPGKEPTITDDARAWVVSLACQKPKEVGYPHELWTTRLLARHVRENAEAAGHPCLTRLAQGTVCKILDRHEVQPHKVRYYLERRDEAFEQKMAEVLCVYREVAVLRESDAAQPNLAIISYDEKPGIQAISSTAPDLPPQPGSHARWAREHEYKRHGTLSLLAGIDLLTGKVHACVENRHRSREVVGFLKKIAAAYSTDTAIKLILDNHSAHISKETNRWLASQRAASPWCLPRNTAAGSTWWKGSSPRWPDPCSAAFASHPRMSSKREFSPTSTTSTANLSSTPGPIRSIRSRDTSRSTETLY